MRKMILKKTRHVGGMQFTNLQETGQSDLIEELRNKLGDAAYGLHSFIHKWQHLQLGHVKRNRKSYEELIEQDYSCEVS